MSAPLLVMIFFFDKFDAAWLQCDLKAYLSICTRIHCRYIVDTNRLELRNREKMRSSSRRSAAGRNSLQKLLQTV